MKKKYWLCRNIYLLANRLLASRLVSIQPTKLTKKFYATAVISDNVLSGRGGILTKEIREAKRDSVGINKQCHQPWHPKYAEHREHGKMVRYNDFSATRGKELQMKVLSDYLFQTASFMHNGIDHVKKEMKRNLKSSAATRRTAPRREDGDDTIVEAEQCAGVAISDLASIINAEVALHPELYLTEEDQESSGAQPTKVSKEDTMIHMCTERNCEKLRLKLALDIISTAMSLIKFCPLSAIVMQDQSLKLK